MSPSFRSGRKRSPPMPGDATPRGPLGDARPDAQERPAAPTPGSLQPEKVEDRDNVGMVSPEDYPEDQRAKLDEGDANRGHRPGRAEKRSGGKECVSTCRTRGWRYHGKKKKEDY